MSANFSDLQSVDTVNDADQMMLRLNNGATGPDGFARIALSALNSAFTSNLTASDAKVKELSAQWSAAYSEVNANSGVFALTQSTSGFWNTAYFALTTNDYPYGNKVFDNIVINGPADSSRLGPILKITRAVGTTVDMMQVEPAANSTLFRITTAGQVGINIDDAFIIKPTTFLYVNGNQVIDGAGGNALTVNGDLFVNGSLSALSATFVTSTITQTSALSVTNNGIGPALFVKQTGVQPTVLFNGDAATITFASDGDITGFNDLSGSGRIIAGASNIASNASSYILGTNNNDNNNAGVIILGSNISAPSPDYTYVQNLSATGIVTAGGKTSIDWNSTYTTVNAQSASLLPLFSTVASQSANNASVYSTTNANSATWGRLNTAFNVVSATNTSALTAIGINANINAALVAKGTGATLAQIPDNTAAGGNARGTYATDLQKSRINNDHVASGDYATIAGGANNLASGIGATIGGGDTNAAKGIATTVGGGAGNTAGLSVASGDYSTIGGGADNITTKDYATIAGGFSLSAIGSYSTIAGGTTNIASSDYSTIGGGKSNNATGIYATIGGGSGNITDDDYATVGGGLNNSALWEYSTVAGGRSNTINDNIATIGGGQNNTATGIGTTIAGGYGNTTTQNYGTIGGGVSNTASGDYSTVVGGVLNSATGYCSTSLGLGASATNYGEFAIGGGRFSTYGDNKSSTFLLRRTTTFSGSSFVYLDGLGSGGFTEIDLPKNSTYAYTATIAGLSSHQDSSHLHYTVRGIAKCNTSGSVTIYNPTTVATSRIPATLNAGVIAAGNSLRVVVYTPDGTPHYWTARVQGEFIKF